MLLGVNFREIIFNSTSNIFSILSQSHPDFKVTGTEVVSCGKICIAFILSWAIVSNNIQITNAALTVLVQPELVHEVLLVLGIDWETT